jgi:hypothetical protein
LLLAYRDIPLTRRTQEHTPSYKIDKKGHTLHALLLLKSRSESKACYDRVNSELTNKQRAATTAEDTFDEMVVFVMPCSQSRTRLLGSKDVKLTLAEDSELLVLVFLAPP